ncbi:hypothetical protein NB037_18515 [Rathayibacter sp. ZW T2_19]|uniref:Uncharacterized protein n=1 Tax=Rathayibacter rubneri TaxID=2950106 RepID=A0A9X2IU51_9MICO|nr:hypothetical protein [Rathayibacter rubneri]MCM6764411.1 hypothetical protein [Rathayibacter rubneri]
MIEQDANGAGALLRALASRVGELRARSGGLLPDADWEDAAARSYADRAAELLGGLAAAEAAAETLALGAP